MNVAPRQLRPLVLFGAVAVAVLAVGITLAARTLLGSFAQVERTATEQKAEQVYRAFEADLHQLQISNRDYAEWDDAVEFTRKRGGAEFIAGNFSASGLTAMHVDLVWVMDAGGHEIYSVLVDRATQTARTPAPRALLEQLRRFQTTDRALRDLPPAQLTVRTSLGLAAVSATEICRTDHSQPTGAMMLFARFIQDEEIQRVRATSQLDVRMTSIGDPRALAELPPDVRTWALGGKSQAYVHVVDDALITGYTVLQDLDRRPVAVFGTAGPREIYALGSRTTRILASSIFALLLAFGVAAVVLLRRLLRLQQRDFEHQRLAEEQRRANRHSLVRQAQQDSLTSLPNRAYLNARLPRVLKKMADSDRLLAVIHLDIDHFKNVNDSRGYGNGDMLLKVVAKRLRAAASSHDVVARMAGDEFVVIAALMPDLAAIDRLAARLQSAVGGDAVIEDKTVNVTASMGIAVHPRDGADVETLFKHADIALHQAKEAGRGCHRFFVEDMNARISDFVMLEQALRHAIGTDQIYMEYQPIIDLRDGRLVSLEALMRWRHPVMGQIDPGRFIPVAERSGLILDIGKYALREVLAQQRAWLDAAVPIVPIAVNVSPLQLERQDFAALVFALAAQAGVEASWVRFEITESAMMKEPERLVGTLRTLRENGSQVLIDDFGTGYSSLSYLDRLPVDILKIDRAFVRDLVREDGNSPIVDAVIDMAKRLNLRTVAEGVENPEQAAVLRERGCDYAQGWLFSKAVSAKHCRALLDQLHNDLPMTESMVMRVLSSG